MKNALVIIALVAGFTACTSTRKGGGSKLKGDGSTLTVDFVKSGLGLATTDVDASGDLTDYKIRARCQSTGPRDFDKGGTAGMDFVVGEKCTFRLLSFTFIGDGFSRALLNEISDNVHDTPFFRAAGKRGLYVQVIEMVETISATAATNRMVFRLDKIFEGEKFDQEYQKVQMSGETSFEIVKRPNFGTMDTVVYVGAGTDRQDTQTGPFVDDGKSKYRVWFGCLETMAKPNLGAPFLDTCSTIALADLEAVVVRDTWGSKPRKDQMENEFSRAKSVVCAGGALSFGERCVLTGAAIKDDCSGNILNPLTNANVNHAASRCLNFTVLLGSVGDAAAEDSRYFLIIKAKEGTQSSFTALPFVRTP